MGDIGLGPGDGSLLERAGELDALAGALATVTSSRQGRIALVAGEAGIGKTALLRHFAASAGPVARVLWARCEPLFTPRPMGPVHELAGAVGWAPAGGAGGTPYDEATALLPLLAAKPTAVIFEDVHWADVATLDVIRVLARRIGAVPVLLMLSYRDDELDRSHPLRVVLGDLPGGGQVVRLTPAGLSLQAVARLALTTDVDPRELHTRTGGNPFFVTEVLATGTETVPPSVQDAVLARAARLREPARDLVDAASVVPGPIEPWLLEALAPGALAELDDCLTTGIMVLSGDSVEFRHQIARQVVEESLPPGRRVGLHAVALAALASPPTGQPDLLRLAHHADAAGDRQAVLTYAPAAAAQAAAIGARRDAARLYSRALRFADLLEPVEQAALLEGFADAAYFTESGAEATEALRKAVEIHRERGDLLRHGDAVRRLGAQFGKDGKLAEARAAITEAVALLEPLPPGRELARAYNAMAAVTGIFDDGGAVEWGKKAIEVAEVTGVSDSLADTLNIVGTAELRLGNLDGLARLDRSRAIAEQAGDELGIARAYVHPAAALAGRREWVLAEPYIARGREFCRERGLLQWYGWLTSIAAEAALARSRWDEAVSTAAEILAWPVVGFTQLRLSALLVTAAVKYRKGEPGHQPLIDEAAALVAVSPAARGGLQVAAARAEAAWLSGAAPERIDEETRRQQAGPEATRWFAGDAEVWRYRIGLDCGDPAELPPPFLLEISGDVEGAADWWQERGCGYDAALALACSDDRLLMRRALGMLYDLGAQAAAAVVSRRLRALGEQGLPRGPRPATAANPVGLTQREVEVLTLLAAGLANPDIAERLVLSTRTVDNHVAAILRKLAVPNRAAARAAATRLGIVIDGPR